MFLPQPISSDVSPGPLNPPRFMGIPFAQLKKMKFELLRGYIVDTSPGTEGREKVQEIVAKRAQDAMNIYMREGNHISLAEAITGVKTCVDTILLCRPFLSPATFSRVREFVESTQDKAAGAGGPLRAVLSDQKKLHESILRYGHLMRRKKITDFPEAIRRCVDMLKALPKRKQPKVLMDLLENTDTAEILWKHIGFTYTALYRERLARERTSVIERGA